MSANSREVFKMELNERKMNILKAIVKDYIETAEAVGSRTISKNITLELVQQLSEMKWLI